MAERVFLTPTAMAREAGMHRREVIAKCAQMGVPIFLGRIDRDLFLAALRDASEVRGFQEGEGRA